MSLRLLSLSLPLLPLLAAQAAWVSWRLPELVEAAGPASAIAGSGGDPVRLLLIGESPAAGVGVPRLELALAGQLGDSLSRHWQQAVRWRAIGRCGITAKEAISELLPRLANHQADLLVLNLGVNDTVRLTRRSTWRRHLETLLNRLEKRFPEVPILLIGMPPVDSFPGFPRPLATILGHRGVEIDRITANLAEHRTGVWYLPPIDQGDPSELFGPDGFHLAPVGYATWAAQIAGEIFARFPQPPN